MIKYNLRTIIDTIIAKTESLILHVTINYLETIFQYAKIKSNFSEEGDCPE
jgi:hypothetical protein